MGLFFIVLCYMIYRTCFYDMTKDHDKKFEKYWDEIEKERKKNNGQ